MGEKRLRTIGNGLQEKERSQNSYFEINQGVKGITEDDLLRNRDIVDRGLRVGIIQDKNEGTPGIIKFGITNLT